jgi:nitroreductase
MEFTEVVTRRESVRNYDADKSVPDDMLRRVLEAGRIAPSATNGQPWEFLVVKSPEAMKKVHKCYDKSWFRDAPVIVIVKGKRQEAWKRFDGYNSLETDLTIAMDHIVLAAENEGLGTCWIGNFDYAELKGALDLKDGEEVFAVTPLWYSKKGYQKSGRKLRKDFDEVVKFL